MSTIIKNANILSNGKILKNYDILISNNIIQDIDKNIIVCDNNIINADGKYVISGLVNACFQNEKNLKNQAKNGVSTIVFLKNDIDTAKNIVSEGYNVYAGIGAFTSDDVLSEEALKVQYDQVKSVGANVVLFANNSFECDEGQFFELLKFSKKYGNIPIFTFTNETLEEVGECDKKYGITPIRLLEEYAILDNPHMLLGVDNCDKDDVEVLGCHDTFACITPTRSLRCGNGVAPVVSLLKHNVKVCVGGDNMLRELALVFDLQSGTLNEANVISINEYFNLASINANALLGRNAGEVKVGQIADLVILDNLNLLDLNTSDVFCTIANGKVIYRR